jgi:HK97 gp10 family phage protein
MPSNDITVSVAGAAGVSANMDAAQQHLFAGVQQALESALQYIYDTSQAACPVDTGALKASGVMKVGEYEGSVSYTEDYAIYVEFGTRNMAAQPYLYPAYIEGMQQFRQDTGMMLS